MKAVKLLFILVFVSWSSFGQNVDSLLNELAVADDQKRVEVLHELIINVWLNYPDQGMIYGKEALALSKKFKDSANISKSLRLIAGVHYYKGDFDSSLHYNVEALNIATALKDSSLMNNGFNNIGLLNYNLGSYQTALEYLFRSKTIKMLTGASYGMPTTLNNIGLVYERVENYEEARKYFLEAYDVAIEMHDQSEIYALNNIGITYLKENRLEVAMSYFRQALNLAKKFDNINWGSTSLRGIGEVYVKQGLLDSAEYYCLQSLEASKSIEDKKGLVEVYNVLAKHALASGQYDKALSYTEQSQEMANQIKLRQHLLDNLKLYIDIFKQKGEEEGVIKYQEEYINLRDSLYRDIIFRNLALVPIKLKEESDRITLSKQQAEIESQNLINKIYGIILLISIPMVIILIVLLRKNRKAHDELVTYNEELQRTQKLLITSEKMASLGIMAAGIAHEINNPLNFIKNGVGALSKKIEEAEERTREDMAPIFRIVNEGVDRASNIVKSLSHFSRKSPKMNEDCDLKDIIENCLLILHNRIKDKVRIVTNFASEGSRVKGNEGRLHQAMMNIISNAEQAIKESGTVTISTISTDKNLEIWVEDDGEGIPEENLSRISDPFFTTKAPGEGTGLGLFITFSIIEEHNGRIDVISSPERGTKFIITIPKE